MLALVLEPLSVRLLAGFRLIPFDVRRIGREAGIREERVGLPAIVLGEVELPLGVGGLLLSRSCRIGLEARDIAQRRGMLWRRHRTAALADQEDHRIAAPDIVAQRFEQRRAPLPEVLLIADVQALAPQLLGKRLPVAA